MNLKLIQYFLECQNAAFESKELKCYVWYDNYNF